MIHGYHSARITTYFSHSTILMMPWNFPRMAWQKRAAWRRLTHEAPSALRKTPIFWGQARTVHGLELRSELIAGSWVDLWSYQELSWVIYLRDFFMRYLPADLWIEVDIHQIRWDGCQSWRRWYHHLEFLLQRWDGRTPPSLAVCFKEWYLHFCWNGYVDEPCLTPSITILNHH